MKRIILAIFLWTVFVTCAVSDDFQSTDGELISETLAAFAAETIAGYSHPDRENARVFFDGGLSPSLMMKRKLESILTSKGIPVTDNPDSSATLAINVTEASVTIVRAGDMYHRTVRLGMHVRFSSSQGLILFADSKETIVEDVFPLNMLANMDDSGLYFRDVTRDIYGTSRRGLMISSFTAITAALFWFAFSG